MRIKCAREIIHSSHLWKLQNPEKFGNYTSVTGVLKQLCADIEKKERKMTPTLPRV